MLEKNEIVRLSSPRMSVDDKESSLLNYLNKYENIN